MEEWAGRSSPTYPAMTQYRAALFYTSEEQKRVALRKIEELEAVSSVVYVGVEPVSAFYRAEEYHQDFINKQMNGAR